MLDRVKGAVIGVFAALAVLAGPVNAAQATGEGARGGADPAPTAKDYQVTDQQDPAGGSGDDGGGPAGSPCFQADGTEVPCQGPNGGWWTGTCWEVVWAHNPEEAMGAWNPQNGDDWPDGPREGFTDNWKALAPVGRTDGAIMLCEFPDGHSSALYWKESAAPPPSSAELGQAARLLLEGRIVAPQIGVYPGFIDGTDPKAPGIVGWPTWFWAEQPGDGVAGPTTASTSVGGYTLRATARLVEIVYDTGDGHQVTCGLGLAPIGRDLRERAVRVPDCGWVYEERGHYTLTATTHVVIEWSAAGRAGTIPITVARSGRYDVAEIQVVIVPGPEPTPR